MEAFFGCRIVKAMKQRTDDFTTKTNKIDAKTIIVFGDSKHNDDFYFGKDYEKLKSFEPIAVEINMLMKLFCKPRINDLEIDYKEQKINIYQLKSTLDRNGQSRTAGYLTRNVPGHIDGEISIGVYDWPPTEVFWIPSVNLINNSYICTKTEKCYYTTNRKKDLERHEKKCTDVQTIISKQIHYGSINDEVAKMTEILNIDYTQFRQRHLVCYDIETFSYNGVCIPVSIAVASTLDGPKYFEKSDDTPEATKQMVTEFMEYLLELQQMLLENLELEIDHAIKFLQAEKDGVFNQDRYQSKPAFYAIYRYFKSYETLKVFGFNSRLVQIDQH